MNNVLILSNHHKRSLLFESGIRRLWDSGFKKVLIQDTGNQSWGHYGGPCQTHLSLGNLPYDQGMMQFKHNIPKDTKYDTILLIDNDCFIGDVDEVKRYIKDFQEGGYDFSCHFVAENNYQGYDFQTSTIRPVIDQQFLPSQEEPKFIPKPHWENAYLLMSKKMWDQLEMMDLSHSRKMIKSVFDKGGKMGAHVAQYRGTWSHYGKGWFHVGNLMAFYYWLEQGNNFSAATNQELARLGYFYFQRNKYGNGIYPRVPKSILDTMPQERIDTALEEWTKLTENTCLQNWSI